MVITKLFSINTYYNVRHSAVKFLYAEGFAGYYRGRYLKEIPQNKFLLTSEKSLTMKQYRSSTNNSDGVFSYRSPFVLRSFSVRSPFVLRSFSVHSPFILRSFSVHSPFDLRSISVRRSRIDRRMIEESSENHRRQDGDVSKL